jgi:hypothetical protein
MEQYGDFLQKMELAPPPPSSLSLSSLCVAEFFTSIICKFVAQKTECVSLQHTWTEFIVISFIILLQGDGIRLGGTIVHTSLFIALDPNYIPVLAIFLL